MTVDELERAMAAHIRPEDDLHAEAETIAGRGWIRRDDDDDGRLWLTGDGESARLRIMESVPEIRALIHAGVDDADYVHALEVLQKLIANTRAT